MTDGLGLAEVIASLREELYAAMVEAAGKLVRFQVGPVDLEFQVQVSREGGGGGKIRFWVVELGAEGKAASASTQVLRIRLVPLDALSGGPAMVHDIGSSGLPPAKPKTET